MGSLPIHFSGEPGLISWAEERLLLLQGLEFGTAGSWKWIDHCAKPLRQNCIKAQNIKDQTLW